MLFVFGTSQQLRSPDCIDDLWKVLEPEKSRGPRSSRGSVGRGTAWPNLSVEAKPGLRGEREVSAGAAPESCLLLLTLAAGTLRCTELRDGRPTQQARVEVDPEPLDEPGREERGNNLIWN